MKLKVPKIPGGWPSDTEASSVEPSRIPTPPPTEKKPKRQQISDMARHSRPAKKIRVQSKASRVLTAMKRPANFLRKKPVFPKPAQAKPALAKSVVAYPVVAKSALARSNATRLVAGRPQLKPAPQQKTTEVAAPAPKPVAQHQPIKAAASAPKPRVTPAGYIDATVALPRVELEEIQEILMAYRPPFMPTGLLVTEYESIGPLGSSGEGSVCLAQSIVEGNGPLVAVKQFHDKTKGNLFAHFPNEVKTMLTYVGTHPNVIQAFQAEIYVDRSCTMSIEYCKGGDLHDRLKHFDRLQIATPVIFSYHLFIQLSEALAFIHNGLTFNKRDYEQNTALLPLIHGDLKPDNILLRPDNMDYGMPTFVLADFGLATLATKPHSAAGTPGYESPEVLAGFQGRPGPSMSVRSDVYTFGMIIYRAITNKRWKTGAKPVALRLPAPYEKVNLEKELRWCLAIHMTDRPAMHGAANGILPFVVRLRKEREAIFKRDGPLDKTLWGRKKKDKKVEEKPNQDIDLDIE
ncbi:hypothetical protein B0A48_10362 [Cryoendolithus antarcticus]|uniref:non-specific serine/threonine protein kinase n=1 Tax=Cryoendolithus antarcticus TaxID=1507870 RepID=A0A1V8SX18_9PEZI|nr:hypothetical protein B0A48_10362 [Cryoendolithus antarcticus]